MRLGPEPAPEAGGWPADERDGAPQRRPRGGQIAWGRVFAALLVLAVLGWAALSPGGIEARLTGVDSGLKNAVADITQNRPLQDASKMFNTWYQQQGSYPNETQSQLDQDPNASWGPGMDITWCTPRDIVLTSLTASGTVSRLLLDGKTVGDVHGKTDCPVDLVDPRPWKR